jgi:hypothetical protein
MQAVFVKGASGASDIKKQPTIASFWSQKKRKRTASENEPDAPPPAATSEPSSTTPESSSETNSTDPLAVLKVDYDLKDKRFAGEGRTITVEFPDFYLVNCYVPNSGQRLERLSYRTSEWSEEPPLCFHSELCGKGPSPRLVSQIARVVWQTCHLDWRPECGAP